MIDFSNMQMTSEQLDADNYRFKVGNDVIVVATNFRGISYLEELQFQVRAHYIRNPNNKPTNPNRTTALMVKVMDWFRHCYLREVERDLLKIASFSETPDGKLLKNYEGERLNFCKGETAHNILKRIRMHYTSTYASGNIYPILMILQKEDGFLSQEIRECLEF